jgi:hypothetical protein
VFPCKENGKEPATENGFHDATTDLARIDRWWSDNPNFNLALCPEDLGWAVIDVEAGGFEQWQALQRDHDGAAIPTYSVVTPRGGRHLYFDGSIRSTTKRLAKEIHKGVGGIDTRGRGGYVLLPPSIVNGRPYTVENDVDVAPLPAWLPPLLDADVQEKSGAFGAPVAHHHLLDLLSSIDPGCDRDTWRNVVAALANTNCDTSTRDLAHNWSEGQFWDGNAPYNYTGPDEVDQVYDTMPPRDDGVGYGTILHHARQSGYTGPSAVDLREPAALVFADALVKLPANESASPVPTNPFRPTNDSEWAGIPEQQWIIDGLVPADSATVLAGETGHYKTFAALDMAMSVATGLPYAGRASTPPRRVFYGAGEGRNDIRRKRSPAWRLVKGLDSVPNFYVMPIPRISIPSEGEAFIRGIRDTLDELEQPGMIVLDTYARTMGGLNENDAADVGLFTVYADRLIREFPGVAVVILAHLGKDKTRGPRGSSALRANMDTYIEVESNKEKMILDLHVVQHRDADDGFHLFFKGAPVADSLYFSPITEAEARKALATEDYMGNATVGAALRALEAFGITKGVSTHVLAQHLVPQQPNQDHEEWQRQVSRATRELAKLSRTRLAGYCEKDGNVLVWFLPA